MDSPECWEHNVAPATVQKKGYLGGAKGRKNKHQAPPTDPLKKRINVMFSGVALEFISVTYPGDIAPATAAAEIMTNIATKKWCLTTSTGCELVTCLATIFPFFTILVNRQLRGILQGRLSLSFFSISIPKIFLTVQCVNAAPFSCREGVSI